MKLSELGYRARRLQDVIRMESSAPIDPLSESLWEFGKELATLDPFARTALTKEWEVPASALNKMMEFYS